MANAMLGIPPPTRKTAPLFTVLLLGGRIDLIYNLALINLLHSLRKEGYSEVNLLDVVNIYTLW